MKESITSSEQPNGLSEQHHREQIHWLAAYREELKSETFIYERDKESIVELIEVVKDLKKVRDKIDSIIETLEIMEDNELMESIERAKKQTKKRDFEEFVKELAYSQE